MWQLTVLASILSGSFIASIFFHELGKSGPRERARNLVFQYAWMLGVSICAWFLLGGEQAFPESVYVIALSGGIVTVGTYFQWRAFAISTSMSALIPALTSAIAFALSGLILNEWQELAEPMRLAGICLVTLGLTLYFMHRRRTAHGIPISFLWQALPAIIVFGVTTFLMNIWAQSNVTLGVFLLAWYGGAFFGSCILFTLLRLRAKEKAAPLRGRVMLLVLGSALSGIAATGLAFVSFEMAGQTLTLPLYAVGGIVGPALVGFLLFKEWRQIAGIQWIYLIIAFAGACMIAIVIPVV
jgi:hypothetical protein